VRLRARASGTFGAVMPKEARLALTNVRVDGRAADLYVYADRLVVATEHGEQVIPMGRLERVATRRSWRGGARLRLALTGNEIVEVRKLSTSTTVTAHRTIVGIARDFH
jgi:hypothetical protein